MAAAREDAYRRMAVDDGDEAEGEDVNYADLTSGALPDPTIDPGRPTDRNPVEQT